MTTLPIPVFAGQLQQETQLCNARDLHKALKVGRDFSTWITGRIEEYGFVDGEDFLVFDSPKRGNQRGRGGDRRTIDYHLTIDMGKELAMLENNDIGRQVRRYFIKAEAELRARFESDLRAMASHVIPLPGVKKRAREGLRLKESLVLQAQSREMMAHLKASQHQAERQNLWYIVKQINDALGIPTQTLVDIHPQ